MRYLITNPDTFGDILLRGPLFVELLNAGYEVAVLVRRSYAPIIPFIDPRIRVFVVEDANPYDVTIANHRPKVEAVLNQVAEFDPDTIVLAPYLRTSIDAWTFDRFKHKRTIGMHGIEVLSENGHRIVRPVSEHVDSLLNVPQNLSELEKNRRLLAMCLGREVGNYRPRLVLPQRTADSTRATLKELALSEGTYIVCSPASATVPVKQYPAERYVNVLAHWVKKYQRPIVLVGNTNEHPTIDEIRTALKKKGIEIETWIGNDSDLGILLGIVAYSHAYFGNDTGPMHFAAAFGKPVVAIFGGGHWPRFVPAAAEGAVIIQELPCFGCGWQCHFMNALCIESLPEQKVIALIDEYESGKLKPFRIDRSEFAGRIVTTWVDWAQERLLQDKQRYQTVYDETLTDRNNYRQAYKTIEMERDHYQQLYGDTVSNRDFYRDSYQTMEKERDRWQTLYNETLANRDYFREAYETMLKERDRWQTLYNEILANRDYFCEVYVKMEKDRNHYQKLYNDVLTNRDYYIQAYEAIVKERNHYQKLYNDVLTNRDFYKQAYETMLQDRDKWQSEYNRVVTERDHIGQLYNASVEELQRCRIEFNEELSRLCEERLRLLRNPLNYLREVWDLHFEKKSGKS